jgi:hypothetical protein
VLDVWITKAERFPRMWLFMVASTAVLHNPRPRELRCSWGNEVPALGSK